jgi:uncharacterized membrane protein YdbT with pleckstrin-like domain
MSYVKENLMPNEKILYSAQVNPTVFLPATFSFIATILFIILYVTMKGSIFQISNIILTIMFFFLTIRTAIEGAVMLLATEFVITNRRIIAKSGFIHTNTIEILLQKIESVNVYQNILGKWLNFGNVTITGTGGSKGIFKAIIDPAKVRAKINQIIEHYAQVENMRVKS